MLLWLFVLFASMAAAAGDYLSIHLETIVSMIGISEELAGVTIFAFGNGSSDLFSTIAAMQANSGSLAISELFGAAAFITTVVLGLVAMIQPFSVDPRSFTGEIVWFMVAASTLTAFLADGQLHLAECFGIIGLYTAFILYSIFQPERAHPSSRSSPTSTAVEVEGEGEDESSQAPLDETSEQVNETTTLLNPETNPLHNSIVSQPGSGTLLFHFSDIDAQSSQSRTIPASGSQSHAQLTISMTIREIFLKICPSASGWSERRSLEKVSMIFSLPLAILVGLTTPTYTLSPPQRAVPSDVIVSQDTDSSSEASSQHGDRESAAASPTFENLYGLRQWLAEYWCLCIQLLTGPQLLAFVIFFQATSSKPTILNVCIVAVSGLFLSLLLAGCILLAHRCQNNSVLLIISLFFQISAFTNSLIWIYLTATSAVSLLKTLGFILSIKDAVLGATIFAVGNSSNDLVANTAVARRGLPNLAASACFGGPMLNMLLGIGIGALTQIWRAKAVKVWYNNGNEDGKYTFDVSSSIFISSVTLLLALGLTLTYAFCNCWRLDRRLGITLISIWTVSVAAQILVITVGI